MIKSMTGYGKADCEFQQKKITIEIKSLNSKQLDLNLKIPVFYKEKEFDIRTELAKELERGKVDIFINVEVTNEDTSVNINSGIIKGYYSQIVALSKEMNLAVPEDLMNTLLRLPDALKADKQELSDAEWNIILQCIRKAIQSLNDFRKQEGAALANDIISRIEKISGYASELVKYESQRVDKIKQRIRTNIDELALKEKIDENRLEQEFIFYIEKLDITEEKVRLANHNKYFLETMNEIDSPGKKLGFIIQEIGREINTIGSKANDGDMQKIVVNMKDELEKIKEQINNVL
jgi:uncharacterized protein (TIGR00255 family)